MFEYFKREHETLSKICQVDHPHLIKQIGSYEIQSQKRGCFLFQWAEGGNLREVWGREKTRPLRDIRMVRWMLKQLRGLCDGLNVLHEHNCRHGDIKPENILLFTEGGYMGTLRLADVGLAKIHELATTQRIKEYVHTNTNDATVRYVAPQFGNVISRKSDVWALGCVFLEFLIWTLYGNEELQNFNKTVPRFSSGEEDAPGINTAVQWWIKHMGSVLDLPDTALSDLLGVIKNEMLVPSDEDRSYGKELHQSLEKIYKRAEMEETYALDPRILDRVGTRAPKSGLTQSKHLAPPGRDKGPRRLETTTTDDTVVQETMLRVPTTVDSQEPKTEHQEDVSHLSVLFNLRCHTDH